MYRCGSTRPFFTDTLNPLPCHGSVCRARRSSISYRSYRFGNNASDLLKQAILAIELKILLATTHFGDEESFSFQAPKLFSELSARLLGFVQARLLRSVCSTGLVGQTDDCSKRTHCPHDPGASAPAV